ncbi:MAG TPA: hypothetical protein VKA10_07980, partial [Prolixibacteraceae bacterium]|nr:hypothetical protein [Prolixibacteraceae bacterium]
VSFLVYLVIMVTISCQMNSKNSDQSTKPSKVEIKPVNGDYNFFVNGELFELKGAGGGGNLARLAQAGGNSIRTWSTRNAEQILDTAAKYNIMVAMGLRMGQELHQFDYNDTAAVGKQYRRNIARVEELKNHPNLLCWVVGNELNLAPDRNVPVNPKVYDALNDIVDYIHKEDPNHPASTTFAGISKEHIHVALERCPDLDFLSLQVYGDLKRIPELVKKAEINKPYVVTEFGPIGHWERPETEWGREIEEPSAEKASGIYKRIQQGIVSDPTGLCLGGYAFLWGQKQERTPTWYGMFLKTGEATAVVDELTRYWTGEYPDNRAPKLDSMIVDGKRAVENVYLKPGTEYSAQVFVSDPDGDSLIYQWEMLKEVVVRSDGGAHEVEPGTVDLEVVSDDNGKLQFVTPMETGEYRLFSYVFDGHNKVGTTNVPFYIKEN